MNCQNDSVLKQGMHSQKIETKQILHPDGPKLLHVITVHFVLYPGEKVTYVHTVWLMWSKLMLHKKT